MSIEMPPELQWVSRLAVGQNWPAGNEDQLSALGDVWNTAGSNLSGVADQLGPLSYGMNDALSGPTGEQFQAFVAQVGSMVPQLSAGAVQVGGMAKDTAVQTQYSKLMILLQLVWIAEQIVEWSTTIWGAAVAAEVTAIGRAVVSAIFRRFVTTVVTATAMQTGMDALVQAFQMFVLKDRTTWNTSNTKGAAEMGAIGGAVGGVLHEVGSAVAPTFMESALGRVAHAGLTGVGTGVISDLAFGGGGDLGLAFVSGAASGLFAGRSGQHGAGEGGEPAIEVPDTGALEAGLPGLADLASLLHPEGNEGSDGLDDLPGLTNEPGSVERAVDESAAVTNEPGWPAAGLGAAVTNEPGWSTTVPDTTVPDTTVLDTTVAEPAAAEYGLTGLPGLVTELTGDTAAPAFAQHEGTWQVQAEQVQAGQVQAGRVQPVRQHATISEPADLGVPDTESGVAQTGAVSGIGHVAAPDGATASGELFTPAESTAVAAHIDTLAEPTALAREVGAPEMAQSGALPASVAEPVQAGSDPAGLNTTTTSTVTQTVHTDVAPQTTAVPTNAVAHPEPTELPRTVTGPVVDQRLDLTDPSVTASVAAPSGRAPAEPAPSGAAEPAYPVAPEQAAALPEPFGTRPQVPTDAEHTAIPMQTVVAPDRTAVLPEPARAQLESDALTQHPPGEQTATDTSAPAPREPGDETASAPAEIGAPARLSRLESTAAAPDQRQGDTGDQPHQAAPAVHQGAEPAGHLDQSAAEPAQRDIPAIVVTAPDEEPTLLLSAGGKEPPPLTRLRIPEDTVLHAQAAAAVPRVVGWKTLLAHSQDGEVVEGAEDMPNGRRTLSAQELADRLNTSDGDFDGVVMVVCEAASDTVNGPAAALHEQSGHEYPILAPTGEAIMNPDGDVLSRPRPRNTNQADKPEPEPVNSWILFKDGTSTTLNTPSLKDALTKIGVEAVNGGLPPDKPVSFMAELSDPQAQRLGLLGYSPHEGDLRADLDPADAAASFYHALVRADAVAPGSSIDRMRELVAQHVEEGWVARYSRLARSGRTVDEVAALIRDPSTWTHEHDLIVPHAAADLFQLHLGVVGPLGHSEAVGDAGRDRRGYPNGAPFVLARLDDRYVAGLPLDDVNQPLPPEREELQPARPADAPNAWSAPFTDAEADRIDQAVRAMGVPSEVPEAAEAARQAAIQNHVSDNARPWAYSGRATDEFMELIRRDLVSPEPGERDRAIDMLYGSERMQEAYSRVSGNIESRTIDQRDRFLATSGGVADEATTNRAFTAAHIIAEAEYFHSEVRPARDTVPQQPRPDGIGDRVLEILNGSPGQPGDDRFREAVLAALDDPEVDGRIRALAIPTARHIWAESNGGIVEEAWRRGATAHAETYARRLAEIQTEVQAVTEWRIRQDNALADLWNARPPRYVPPGFGEVGPGGARQYPMGRSARFVRLDEVEMRDYDGVADHLARFATAVPQGPVTPEQHLRLTEMRTAIRSFIDNFGTTALAQRLLEDGLDLDVEHGAGGGRELVRLQLELDPALAHETNPNVLEREPLGMRAGVMWHNPVESDHETTAVSGRTVASELAVGGSVNAGGSFGALPHRVVSEQVSVSGSATTSRAHRFGDAAVSATKRLFEPGSGQTAHFDFPAVLTARAAAPGERVQDQAPRHSVHLNTRFGFPEDLAPPKPPDAAPGVLHEQHAGPEIGLSPAALAAEQDPNGPNHLAATRVAEVQHHFFTVGESVGGLQPVRDEVIRMIGGARADRGIVEGVHYQLGELSVLRMLSDITGAGWTSPELTSADDRTQMRMTVSADLRSAVPLGVGRVSTKQESQRFINSSEGDTDGDTAGLTPGFTVGHTFRDVSAPTGGNDGISFNPTGSGRYSYNRSTNVNTGSGHISGLVYAGDSVLYRATYHMQVRVEPTDRPGGTFGRDVTVFLRLPVHQRARFEEMLADRADTTTAPRGLDSYQQDAEPVDHTVPVSDEERAERGLDRNPPLALAAGRGIGFSAISHLAGSEKVLPRLVDMVRNVGANVAYSRRWDERETDLLRTELASRFTAEGLTNWGTALFQDGGVRMEYTRPAEGGGREVITATVRGLLQNRDGSAPGPGNPLEPVGRGRVSDAKLEIMPSAFAGNSGTDAVGRGATGSLQSTGTIGLGTDRALRTLSLSLTGSGGRDRTAELSVGASGFMLEAILYSGPVRTFDHRVAFDMEVSSRHEPGYNVPDRVTQIPDLARGLAAGRTFTEQSTAASARERVEDGRARFVIVEKLAPRDPVADVRTADAGVPRRIPDPPALAAVPRSAGRQDQDLPLPVTARHPALPPEMPAVNPPRVQPHLAGGHVPLHADDQVTEVLGGAGLARELVGLLHQVGVPPETYRHTPWMLTSSETLAASQVRGPSDIRQTLFMGEKFADRRVVITLTGFPHNLRAGSEEVPIFRMHVAEGNTAVSSADTRATSYQLKGALNLGLTDFTDSRRTEATTPSFSGSWNARDATVVESTGYTSNTGRLIQGEQPYVENNADMLWRMSVVVHGENRFLNTGPIEAHALVEVPSGISFLRLAEPVPAPRSLDDVRAVPRPANAPVRVPQRLTVGGDGNTMPATPGSTVRIPRDSVIPPSATSERLMAPRPAHLVGFDVTGAGNPVFDGVQRLLREHAPGFLDQHFTAREGLESSRVPGGALDPEPERGLPASLSNLLNPGSLEALVDPMLGTGLVLTASRPLLGGAATERLHLVIRATRQGDYSLVQYLDSANVSRYSFRLNSSSETSVDPHAHSETFSLNPILRHAPSYGSHPLRPFQSVNAAAGVTLGSTSDRSHTLSTTDAVRDTHFLAGPAGRYIGELSINISMSRITFPSHTADAAFGGIPRAVGGFLRDVGITAPERPSIDVTMLERVIVPTELMNHDMSPEPADPGTAAVTEVPAGSTAASLHATRFPVTRDELLNHDAFVTGVDHQKFRVMLDEAVPRFSGDVLPHSGDQVDAVAALVQEGTRSRDAFHYLLSHPMVTRQMELMLSADGFTSPLLVREGGPIGAAAGHLRVRVELVEPRIRGESTGWVETVDYGFREFNSSNSTGSSRNLNVSAGTAENAGNLHANQHADSIGHQTVTWSASTTPAQSVGSNASGILKTMPRRRPQNQQAARLHVSADAIVHLDVNAGTVGALNTAGGTVSVSFRLHDAVELALSPETALAHGLINPGGLTIPSGVFAPAHGAEAALHVQDSVVADVEEMYNLRGVDPERHFVVYANVIPADGTFVVGDRALSAAEFHAQVIADRDLVGRDVVLLSTHGDAAVDGDSAARQLARLTGRRVVATTQGVGWTRDGAIRTYRTPDRPPMGPFEEGSRWRLVTPDGELFAHRSNVLDQALADLDDPDAWRRVDSRDTAASSPESGSGPPTPPAPGSPLRRGSLRRSLTSSEAAALSQGTSSLGSRPTSPRHGEAAPDPARRSSLPPRSPEYTSPLASRAASPRLGDVVSDPTRRSSLPPRSPEQTSPLVSRSTSPRPDDEPGPPALPTPFERRGSLPAQPKSSEAVALSRPTSLRPSRPTSRLVSPSPDGEAAQSVPPEPSSIRRATVSETTRSSDEAAPQPAPAPAPLRRATISETTRPTDEAAPVPGSSPVVPRRATISETTRPADPAAEPERPAPPQPSGPPVPPRSRRSSTAERPLSRRTSQVMSPTDWLAVARAGEGIRQYPHFVETQFRGRPAADFIVEESRPPTPAPASPFSEALGELRQSPHESQQPSPIGERLDRVWESPHESEQASPIESSDEGQELTRELEQPARESEQPSPAAPTEEPGPSRSADVPTRTSEPKGKEREAPTSSDEIVARDAQAEFDAEAARDRRAAQEEFASARNAADEASKAEYRAKMLTMGGSDVEGAQPDVARRTADAAGPSDGARRYQDAQAAYTRAKERSAAARERMHQLGLPTDGGRHEGPESIDPPEAEPGPTPMPTPRDIPSPQASETTTVPHPAMTGRQPGPNVGELVRHYESLGQADRGPASSTAAPRPEPDPAGTTHSPPSASYTVDYSQSTDEGAQTLRIGGDGRIQLSTGEVLPSSGWASVGGRYVHPDATVTIGPGGRVAPAGAEDRAAAAAQASARPDSLFTFTLEPFLRVLNLENDEGAMAYIPLSVQQSRVDTPSRSDDAP
jgi:hypothetical protein